MEGKGIKLEQKAAKGRHGKTDKDRSAQVIALPKA